jgi:hypothetical protein
MRSSIKSITVTLTFCSFLATISLLCLLRGLYPVDYSAVEKRPMAQFPEDVTWQSLADKTAIEQFEDFTVDQFPLREYFRTLKAHFVMRVLGCKQNNGYAYENGSIAQIKTAFDQANINRSLDRLSYICERYLSDQNAAYLTIIPDKNYFFAKDYGYPAPDYAALVDQAKQRLPQLNYIDLFDALTLDDYYKTDWHWDQSRLGNVVQLIGERMGFGNRLPTDYEQHTLAPFYGGYHDQSALYPPSESLTYLTNDIIDACTLYDYATGEMSGLYVRELFDSNTSYDFFMAGMRGLQRIDNPIAATNDELIVFRDSFGSSLLPLVAQGYKTVYVVDIRNVLPETLGSVLDFSNKDVLFLFSTTVLDSATFK